MQFGHGVFHHLVDVFLAELSSFVAARFAFFALGVFGDIHLGADSLPFPSAFLRFCIGIGADDRFSLSALFGKIDGTEHFGLLDFLGPASDYFVFLFFLFLFGGFGFFLFLRLRFHFGLFFRLFVFGFRLLFGGSFRFFFFGRLDFLRFA